MDTRKFPSQKLYRVSDFNIHIYGRGRNKNFVFYTDYDETEHRWRTKVYPDAHDKKTATKEVMEMLMNEVPDPYIKRGLFKVSLGYDW